MTLKELLKKNRYSVPVLAEELGVSCPTIYKWVHKEAEPSPKRVKALAEKLNVTVAELIDVLTSEEQENEG